MKRSIVFLTPASADKKGEVVELEYESEPLQYLEPYAENDATAKLRHDLHEARARLQHAKSRGKGVAEAQKNLAAAKAAVGKVHYDQAKAREQQRTGSDYGAVSPFQHDTRMFMPVRDYSAEREGDLESPSEELSEEQLTAKILAAVAAIETAQSDGAPWAEILRLEAALKVLRDQLDNPSAPPKDTTAAPPRKEHITRPSPTQPTGQAAVKKKFFAAIDASQAKRRKARQATHSADVCCSGKYLCAKCQAKKAAPA